ncbi:leucyl aminopeptidase [Candidatus Phytoplasma sp. AldY-WA1]|uniref:leucyl aminopeptidase n=1 Tax=Candidatus Phytoplasma sp. AldY-WA1 TaxID=2852100 RepID=UPI00254C024F|nr:leucyl aminopeptidase [Candidatus Phytoplasma sp. AldY-WA1]
MNMNFSFSKEPILNGDVAILLKTIKNKKTFGLKEVDPQQTVLKAMSLKDFEGKENQKIELLVPHGSPFDRLNILGLGDVSSQKNDFWVNTGGKVFDLVQKAKKVVIFLDLEEKSVDRDQVKDFLIGFMLKNYTFDRYLTTKKKDNEKVFIHIINKEADHCQKVLQEAKAVAEGVHLSRDLVNEPANVLGTEEFLAQTQKLKDLGVIVEVLDKKAMTDLGMKSLLAVSQGSSRPPFLVIMNWKGSHKEETPLAFIGKGVVFDTGGISIKPSSGMEDMKADMSGAATVVGLMHLLASRKAKVNVVGVIGLVENTPSSTSQRPGDIVVSMSGQTIEVINTDAEGRMVLADALWYCETILKPKLMIDLATLTGAILVALGQEHAGLFSNETKLTKQLLDAGNKTGERLWLMPLSEEYDRLINSKNADMKNSAGRYASSITAAQFLKRFVHHTPWAHLDIAGTAMGTKPNSINNSWGTGFGVRLLNEFIKVNYEK